MKKLLLLLLLHLAVLAALAQSGLFDFMKADGGNTTNQAGQASPVAVTTAKNSDRQADPVFGSAAITISQNSINVDEAYNISITDIKDKDGNPYLPFMVQVYEIGPKQRTYSLPPTQSSYSHIGVITFPGTYKIKVEIDGIEAALFNVEVSYIPVLTNYEVEVSPQGIITTGQEVTIQLKNFTDQYGKPYTPKSSIADLSTKTIVASPVKTAPDTYSFKSWGLFTMADWLTADGIPLSVNTNVDGVVQTIPLTAKPGRVLFVNENAYTVNGYSGMSWDWATPNLQDALSLARIYDNVEEIWVAKGTYYPTSDPSDRNASFSMVKNVAIYGGFVGGETTLSQRNWQNNPTILSGDIDQNDATDGNGGNSYKVVKNESFQIGQSAILDGFTITGGNGNDYGAGMYNRGASPSVVNCKFIGNVINASNGYTGGAGIYNSGNSSARIINCIFLNNHFSGGGDYCGGGGMQNYMSRPIIINCSFSGNSALVNGNGSGGAAIFNCLSNAVYTNCVAWGNTASGGAKGIQITFSNPTVTYSLIEDFISSPTGNNLNGTVNPLFVDASTGDLRLQPCSPAIGKGDNSVNDSETDLNGKPRLMGSRIDLGAYEYQYTTDKIVYVNANSPSATPDGETWATAYKNLQDALARTKTCPGVNQIWVAKGTYYPDQGAGINPGRRDASFVMVAGVKIYGGFSGNGTETDINQRDWTQNPTVLNGDIDHASDPQQVSVVDGFVTITGNSGNSYHVIYNSENGLTNENSLLDGFTVTGGHAYNEDLGIYDGGGMFNYGSYPGVRNCHFTGNVAGDGAGISNLPGYRSNHDKKVFPFISNTIFSHNYAENRGGGLSNETDTAVVEKCRFVENSANKEYGDGGGMSIGGKAFVDECHFQQNLAHKGGGLFANGRGGRVAESGLLIKNCLFVGNIAEIGGGQHNIDMPLAIYNCAFSGNSARDEGGGLFILGSSPSITNSTFSGNYAGTSGGGIATVASPTTFTNCIIWGNAGGEVTDSETFPSAYSHSLVKGLTGGTDGNLDGTSEANNPLFLVQPVPSIAGSVNGNLHLAPCSPVVNKGDNGTFTAADKDLDGNSRLVGGTIDLGAYEYQAESQSLITWYQDADGDGYAGTSQLSCGMPAGTGWTSTVLPLGDCEDEDAAINPGVLLTLATPDPIRANTSDDGTGDCTVSIANIPPPAVIGNNCKPHHITATVNGNALGGHGYTFSTGTTKILWTLSFSDGQTSTVEQEVIVTDNEAPALIDPAVTPSSLNQTGVNECETVAAQFDPTTLQAALAALYKDNCSGVATVQFMSKAGKKKDKKKGKHTGEELFCGWSFIYTFEISDANGNSFTVNVERSGADGTPPTGTAPAAITGVNSCKPTQAEAQTAFDADYAASTYSDGCSGGVEALLTNTVVEGDNCAWTVTYTFSVTDGCDNMLAGQTYQRRGGDKTPPVLTGIAYSGQTGINACRPSQAAAIAAFDAQKAIQGYQDNCGGTVLAILTNTVVGGSNGNWNVTYTYTVTDACNNPLAGLSYSNSGADRSAPVLTPAPNQTVNLNGSCTITIPDVRGTATDNCSVTISQLPAAGSIVPATHNGTVNVTVTAEDAAGNKDTKTVVLTAKDIIPPTITCPQSVTINPTSLSGAPYSWTAPVGADNCSGPVTTRIDAGPASGATFPVGTTTISYKVVDRAGLTATCSFTVTVRDPYSDRNSKKVWVCHSGKTTEVSENAVAAHLAHGDKLGKCDWYGINLMVSTKTAEKELIEEKGLLSLALSAAPNPVQHSTRIRYTVPVQARVSIRVFDVLGREIGQVFSGQRAAGTYVQDYNTQGLSGGVYYLQLSATTTDGKAQRQSLKLVKAN